MSAASESTRDAEREGAGPADFGTDVAGVRARHPTVGFAAGVVRGGGLAEFQAHGLADIARGVRMRDDTVLRVASISKTFITIAVLQLVEDGAFDLDTPADDLLRSYRLVPRRPGLGRPTVRHLLTHTAGLPETIRALGALRPEFGEAVAEGAPLPDLAEFYRGRLAYGAEPGSRFVYGNHGFATLGQIIEDQTGTTLAERLRERIFEPLAMDDSSLGPSARTIDRRARSYTIGRRGAVEVPEREMVTAGAAAVLSTPADMARYLAALLAGGVGERGRVLESTTVATMFDAHYRPHPSLEGIGLGFFRTALAGHRLVEHSGVMSGFVSQLFLAPDDGVAVMAFTNGASGAMFWLPGETLGLLKGELPGASAPEPARAHRPEQWNGLIGWYALSARMADVRMRMMMGAGLEVTVREGRLWLRFLTVIPQLMRGFPLLPAGKPDLYRLTMDEGATPLHVAFTRDESGRGTAAYIDIMPATATRRPDMADPRRALSAAATATVARFARDRD